MAPASRRPIRRRQHTVPYTPEEELEIRYTGEPEADMANLIVIDAENTSKLSALFLHSALRHREDAAHVAAPYREEAMARAVRYMEDAQRLRK